MAAEAVERARARQPNRLQEQPVGPSRPHWPGHLDAAVRLESIRAEVRPRLRAGVRLRHLGARAWGVHDHGMGVGRAPRVLLLSHSPSPGDIPPLITTCTPCRSDKARASACATAPPGQAPGARPGWLRGPRLLVALVPGALFGVEGAGQAAPLVEVGADLGQRPWGWPGGGGWATRSGPEGAVCRGHTHCNHGVALS